MSNMNFLHCVGVAFLCSLALTYGGLVGEKKCTWGPKYWCDNIKNSKECNAVSHCIKAVWELQSLPEDNDDICSICKEMVKEARDQLMSNETEEELKEVMEGSCNLIPVKVIDKECLKLVDEFIPELIEMLASQMEPQVVCSTAGLCNSQRIDEMLKRPELKKKDTYNKKAPFSVQLTLKRRCKDCVKYTGRLEKVLKNPSLIEEYMMELCGRTGSFSDSCRSIALTYSTEILNVLGQFDANEFCKFSTFCADIATKTVPAALQYTSTGDTECDFCSAVVSHWVDILTFNTTKEEFREMFLMICAQTGRFANECKSLVLEYYEVIYDTLVNDINPKDVCKAVGLCGASIKYKPIWHLSLRNNNQEVKKVQVLHAVPLTKGVVSSNEHPLQKYFASRKMPKPIGNDEANSYSVNNNIDLVLGSQIGAEMLNTPDMGGTSCMVCQYILHELQNYITSNSTEAEIESELEKVCLRLPKNVAPECNNLVVAYSAQIIAMLTQKIDPSVVCPAIHVCPGSVMSPEAETPAGPPCAICTMVMKQLFKLINATSTAEEVRDALDAVCDLLPEKTAHQCEEIVNTYTDIIIDSVLANLTPIEVCHLIALCSVHPRDLLNDIVTKPPGTPIDPDAELYWPVQLNSELAANNPLPETLYGSPLAYYDVKCTVCETTMEELHLLVETNSSAAEIMSMLNGVCNKVPGKMGEECRGLVKAYGPAIVDLIKIELSDPVQFCKELKLCLSGMIQTPVDRLNLDECNACRLVVENLENLLDDENVEDDIEQNLEKLCDFVPSSFRAQCHRVLQEYGAYIISIVANNIDSKMVCSDLRMCPQEPTVVLLP